MMNVVQMIYTATSYVVETICLQVLHARRFCHVQHHLLRPRPASVRTRCLCVGERAFSNVHVIAVCGFAVQKDCVYYS